MRKTEKYICIESYEDFFGNLYQKDHIKEIETDHPTTGAGAFVQASNYEFKLLYSVPATYWKKIPPSKLEQALERLTSDEKTD